MTEYYVPSEEEFKDAARREFGFLKSEFAFKESHSPFKDNNPYSIFLHHKNAFVYIEGLSYGYSLGVQIGKLGIRGNVKERFSLDYVVGLRRSDFLEPKFPAKRGQIEQMKSAAFLLKECANDFLKGDFSALPEVIRYQKEVQDKSRREYEAAKQKRIGIQASEAFHAKDYKKVIKLLSPFEKQLSAAEQLMLSQSRKHHESQA
jgi:hypothetical protein